ncbi:hypothetical protein SLE2022_324040 [Rubroshorea leprosula]
MIGNHYENWIAWSEAFDNVFDCENGSKVRLKEGKGRRLWKKVKYQLVEFHSLPAYLRDNEFILGHYRAEWPLKQIFLSIFYIHNETLNVWTHLIGFFLFLFLTIYTAARAPVIVAFNSLQRLLELLKGTDLHKIQKEILNCLPSLPNMTDLYKLKDDLKTSLPSMNFRTSLSNWNILEVLTNCLPERLSRIYHPDDSLLNGLKSGVMNIIPPLMVQPITRWPFFAFLGGAMFCLLASSTCHLLACHSQRLSYIMLRIDYAGTAALISTSFFPPVYYSFMCKPFFRNLYLGSITTLGVLTVAISLLPVFQKPHFRSCRALLFFGMGISGIAPILHKLILFKDQPEALETTAYEVLMGTFCGTGALIYATRDPERWKPGRFDIAGHSQQLFHILEVAGAYTHYRAGLVYLHWRDSEGC